MINKENENSLQNQWKQFEKDGLKIKYYYENLPVLGNVLTVCIIYKDEKLLSRGLTIRSPFDNHVKKIARENSFKMAMRALLSKKTSEPILLVSLKNEKVKYLNCKDNKLINTQQPLVIKYPGGNFYFLRSAKRIGTIEVSTKSFLNIAHHYGFEYKSYFEPIPTESEFKFIGGSKKE